MPRFALWNYSICRPAAQPWSYRSTFSITTLLCTQRPTEHILTRRSLSSIPFLYLLIPVQELLQHTHQLLSKGGIHPGQLTRPLRATQKQITTHIQVHPPALNLVNEQRENLFSLYCTALEISNFGLHSL